MTEKEILISEATSTVNVLDDLIRAAKSRQARIAASDEQLIGVVFLFYFSMIKLRDHSNRKRQMYDSLK